MATLYWVGGSGTWVGGGYNTLSTNWSITSGVVYSGGSPIPQAYDDVVFDSGSGNGGPYTVTIGTGGGVCANCTISATSTAPLTIAGAYPRGNFTADMTNVSGGTYGFSLHAAGTSTHILTVTGTSATKKLQVYMDAVYLYINTYGGPTVTLGSSMYADINMSAGIFNTNNFALNGNIGYYSQGTSATTTVNLGSSIYTGDIDQYYTYNTLNANTASIIGKLKMANFNCGTSTIYSGSITIYQKPLYNVICSGGTTISGATSINNLTVNSPSIAPNFGTLVITGGTTTAPIPITGTLSLNSGGTGNKRITMLSSIISVAAINASASVDVDFKNVSISGAVSPISGVRFGNYGGNTGINFTAPSTKYINTTATLVNTSDNIWTTISGGTPSLNNFPLPQDSIIINNSSIPSGATIVVDNPNLASLDASSRNTPLTLSWKSNISLVGSIYKFSSNILHDVTVDPGYSTTNRILYLNSPTSVQLTCGGTKFDPVTKSSVSYIPSNTIGITCISPSFQSTDGMYVSGKTDIGPYEYPIGYQTKNASFSNDNYTFNSGLSIQAFTSLILGTGTINASNGDVYIAGAIVPTLSTIGTINLTNAYSFTNLTSYKFNNIIINTTKTSHSMTFRSAPTTDATYVGTSSGYNGAITTGSLGGPLTIIFTSTVTYNFTDWKLTGSYGKEITLQSSNAGSRFTISQGPGKIAPYYLKIKDCAATGGATWLDYNGVNLGNNTGWYIGPPESNMLLMFY
jgi:hypothetical protein